MKTLAAISRPSGIGVGFGAGLAVHALALLVFAVLAVANIEGCDRSDSLGAALGIAASLDILLVILLVGGLLVGLRSRRRWMAGLGCFLSLVPAGVLLVAGEIALNGIPSGCA